MEIKLFSPFSLWVSEYLKWALLLIPDHHKHMCFFSQVNFDKVPMEMRLPVHCPIKRDFLSGIQVEFKQSPHQRILRARLYWLQVTLSFSVQLSIPNHFGKRGDENFLQGSSLHCKQYFSFCLYVSYSSPMCPVDSLRLASKTLWLLRLLNLTS